MEIEHPVKNGLFIGKSQDSSFCSFNKNYFIFKHTTRNLMLYIESTIAHHSSQEALAYLLFISIPLEIHQFVLDVGAFKPVITKEQENKVSGFFAKHEG